MGRAAYWSNLDDRLAAAVEKALRRKPSGEARLASAVRAAAPYCPKLHRGLVSAAEVLIGREGFSRPLYGAAIRSLAERRHAETPALLAEAMRAGHGGGLHTMAAAAHCDAPSIREPLARVAASPKPHMAFAANLVMRLRDQARPGHLLASVARIKESARIDLCTELLAPMLLEGSLPSLPPSIAAPMLVLRDSERHLGRWLVFARGGLAAGDRSAVEEAERKAREGSQSSRVAWALLAWAVEPGKPPPEVRPSAEVVARLSDRPTSEKDMSFVFRLASVRAAGARSMLQTLCKGDPRGPMGMRAAAKLAAHYDDARGLDGLRKLADGGAPRELMGLSVACLWDAGQHAEAVERALCLREERNLASSVWGGLVVAASAPVVDEVTFRRLERTMVQ